MVGNILVVEDSKADLLLISKILLKSGLEVDSAQTIEEAINYLKDNSPRMIFLDYYLPDGDALELVDNYHNQFPIVMLTGSADKELGLKAVRKGAQDFINKGGISDSVITNALKYAVERHSLKKRITASEKMASLGKLASGVAHEMNTPIQYIGDNLYFLQNQFESILKVLSSLSGDIDKAEVARQIESLDLEFIKEEVKDALEQSISGMGKIDKLVKALKEFAENETTNFKKLNLNKLIDEQVCSLKSDYPKIKFSLELDETLTSIVAERSRMDEIFKNILENALFELQKKFGEGNEGGEISVATKQQNDFMIISIKDNGRGMTDEVQQCLFDPFFTTKSFDGSLGQGLAMVHRQIHEVYNGSITVTSEEGNGSLFKIQLPNQQFTS